MKANQLLQIIKNIVTEEVRTEVKNQLPKLLFEMIGTSAKISPPQQIMEEGNEPVEESPKKAIKQYVRDPILNQIMNETKVNPQLMRGHSMVDLMDGEFDKIGQDAKINTVMNEVIPVQPSSESADLSVLFKDPKKLGKILKESKNKTGGGMINPASIMQQW